MIVLVIVICLLFIFWVDKNNKDQMRKLMEKRKLEELNKAGKEDKTSDENRSFQNQSGEPSAGAALKKDTGQTVSRVDLDREQDNSKKEYTFLEAVGQIGTFAPNKDTNNSLPKETAETVEKKAADNLKETESAEKETAQTVNKVNESYKDAKKVEASGTQAAKPRITKPKIKFKMPDKNLYSILLMTLGVVFVLLAGILFATTNWGRMPGFAKLFCIVVVVLIFYVLSFLAEKRLKLSFISRSLYMLASFLLFMAVIAIAYFELFGIYLSLREPTRYLAFFIASLSTEISLLLALKKFNKRWYTDICLYGISVCICFLVMAFNMPLAFTITYLTVYAILCVIADLYIEKSNTALLSKALKTDISAFAQTNLLAVSIMVMFFFRRDMHQGIVTIVLAIVHLYLGDKRENKINSAGFVVFLALAVYRIAYGGYDHSILYMLCMLLSIFAGVSMIGSFKSNTRTYANIASNISCAAIIIGVVYYYFFPDQRTTELASLLSLALVWIYVLINDIRYRGKKVSLLNILTLIVLVNYAAAYFGSDTYALQAVINVVIFTIIIVLKNRLNIDYKTKIAVVADISFFTALAFLDYATGENLLYSMTEVYALICLILTILVYYILAKENPIFNFFTPGFFVGIIYIAVSHVSNYIQLEWAIFIYFVLGFAYKLLRRKNIAWELILWANIFGVMFSAAHIYNRAITAPYFILSALYMLLYLVLSKEKKEPRYHGFMLTDLLFGTVILLYYSDIYINFIIIILAAASALIAVLYRHVLKEREIADSVDRIAVILGILSIWDYTFAISQLYSTPVFIYGLSIMAFCILYNIKSNIEKKYKSAIVNSLAFWCFFMTKFMLQSNEEERYLVVILGIVIPILIAAWSRYKSPIVKEGRVDISSYDWWNVFWGMHIVLMILFLSTGFFENEYIRSVYVLLMSIYFLQYITVKEYRPLAPLGSAISFVIFVWIQDLIEIPAVYEFEVNVFALLAIPLSLKWMLNKKEYRIANVAARTIVLSMLTFEAITVGRIEDTIAVLVFAVVLLVYSSIRNHRKEFLIAFSFAITMAVFMTRAFWQSVAWFVYLFAAGLLLIGLAVYNETRRKKQEAKQQVKQDESQDINQAETADMEEQQEEAAVQEEAIIREDGHNNDDTII